MLKTLPEQLNSILQREKSRHSKGKNILKELLCHLGQIGLTFNLARQAGLWVDQWSFLVQWIPLRSGWGVVKDFGQKLGIHKANSVYTSLTKEDLANIHQDGLR